MNLSIIVILFLLGNAISISSNTVSIQESYSKDHDQNIETSSTGSTVTEPTDVLTVNTPIITQYSKEPAENGLQTNSILNVIIPYNDEAGFSSLNDIDSNYSVYWSFDYSNGIQLTVLLLNGTEFYNYAIGSGLSGITLSSGMNMNAGNYLIPYTSTWYVLFLHQDSANINDYSGKVRVNFIDNQVQTVFITDISHYTVDGDDYDGVPDSILIYYDLDVNFGTLNTYTILYLYDTMGNLVSNSYQENEITGIADETFAITVGPAFISANYYYYFYVSSLEQTGTYDYVSSSYIYLNATTRSPNFYFASSWYDVYDSDYDGYDDLLELNFDINIEHGVDNATVDAYLYNSNGIAVDGQSYIFFIEGRLSENFVISFYTTIQDIYYVELLVYRANNTTPTDISYHYDISLGHPTPMAYFGDIYFVRNDVGNDGTYESVKLLFDANLNYGSGTIGVVARLYFGNNIVQELSSDHFIILDEVESTQINFNSVSQNGYYYIEAELYFSNTFEADEIWVSNSFQLTPQGNIPSSSNPPSGVSSTPSSSSSNNNSSDNNNSTTNDPISGLSFSNGLAIILSLGFAAIFRTILRNKNPY